MFVLHIRKFFSYTKAILGSQLVTGGEETSQERILCFFLFARSWKSNYSFMPVKVILNYTCPCEINSKLYLPGKWNFLKPLKRKKKKSIKNTSGG